MWCRFGRSGTRLGLDCVREMIVTRQALGKSAAALLVSLVVGFVAFGCQPPPDAPVPRAMTMTVQEMARGMAESIVRAPGVRNSQYKLVVRMRPVNNQSRYGVSDVILDDIRATLNRHAMDRMVFVMGTRRSDGGIDDGSAAGGRRPTHYLTGTFRDFFDTQTDATYWQCTFQLYESKSDIIIWEDIYRNVRPRRP